MLAVACTSGCTTVPDVAFDEACDNPDGGCPRATANRGVGDAGGDATSSPAVPDAGDLDADDEEAVWLDASVDSAPFDGAATTTCPGAAPPGAQRCCGSTACGAPLARRCDIACDACERLCPGRACCLKIPPKDSYCVDSPDQCRF